MRCFALRLKGSDGGKGRRTAAPEGLAPSDLINAYHLPSNGGEGATIAIVDAFDDPNAAADLAVYRAQFGLPTLADGQFTKVNQRGTAANYPLSNEGWAEEEALDIEMVTAVAPKAKILLVEADSASVDNLGESVNTAVALGAMYVSNSYGSAYTNILGEKFGDLAAANVYYEHTGVAVVASSGDEGYGVAYPASLSSVTSVGGTSLTREPSTARGWTESAWAGSGSGCSTLQAKPSFQKNAGCDHRAVSDVSAVADPNTGVALYNTYGNFGQGWSVFGGTSASAPISTATYALAGPVAKGTSPNAYPYANPHLNDVTTGSNGTCVPTYLCHAGAGYDGPTGLGTPNGIAGFRQGATGTLSGTAKDPAGAPLSGLTVSVKDSDGETAYTATTDSKGAYRTPVAPGTYGVSAARYGYDTGSTHATVAAGRSVTANLALRKKPLHKVTGKVTDGSGRGWPLAAKVTFDGVPGVFTTDPRTGVYSANLPSGTASTMHTTPLYPGYTTPAAGKIEVGDHDVIRDVSVLVDRVQCAAPGFGYLERTDFENWPNVPQDNWTVSHKDGVGKGWQFGTSIFGNLANGTGEYAAVEPYMNDGTAEDTILTSPSFDLSGRTDVSLHFRTFFFDFDGGSALDVDLSADGGGTWTTVDHIADVLQGQVDIPLTSALGHPEVKVRFHYAGKGSSMAQLDDVTVGECEQTAGGIVTGTVRNAATQQPVAGATVTDVSAPNGEQYRRAVSAADGSYWLYSPTTGRNILRTGANRYSTLTADTRVSTGVTAYTPRLHSPQLKVTEAKIPLGAELDGRAGRDVTLTNIGSEPLHVTLHEQSQNPSSTVPHAGAGAAWQGLPDYPEPVEQNVVASYEGKVYSIGGSDGVVGYHADNYVTSPGALSWSRIAPLPERRSDATGAFVNGVLYIAGGYAFDGKGQSVPVPSTVAYHPATDTWSRVADRPGPAGGGSPAVLDGKLYVIGSQDAEYKEQSDSYRYDPTGNTWKRVADYPVQDISSVGCAGINDTVVCAGGVVRGGGISTMTWIYHPTSNQWTRGADMPFVLGISKFSAANGKLQVVGGLDRAATLTGRGVEYDPITDSWGDLPEAPLTYTTTGHGTGCGVWLVGGKAVYANGMHHAATLPGYDQCGGDDVNWLSLSRTKVTLAPGQSTKIRVTGDASTLTRPGAYAASLFFEDDSPTVNQPVPVTFKATAPSSYAEVAGTIGLGSRGVLGGAKVTLSRAGKVLATTTADSQGRYDLWVAASSKKTTVKVSHEGYTSRTKEVTTKAGHRTTADFTFAVN